jgi:hypothetical protein
VTRWLVLVAAFLGASCHTFAPVQPRFVVLYEQRHRACRLTVLQDLRSRACFIWAQCGRQPSMLLATTPDVCVP